MAATSAGYEYEYFLSFNEENETYAREVEAVLRGRGCSAWLQTYDSRRGGIIDEQIQDAVTKSRHFVALVGPRYEKSPWTKDELRYFLGARRERDFDSRKLLVLECEPVDLVDRNLRDVYRGCLFDRRTAKPLAPEARRQEIIDTLDHEPAQEPGRLTTPFDHDMPEPAACVGRERRLEEIADHFFPATATPRRRRRVLIQAGPGFGKTTLAAYYARRGRGSELFKGVWWFPSDDRSVLLDRIIEKFPRRPARGAARPSDPDPEDREQSAIKALEEKFGDTDAPFLLFFDNVTSSGTEDSDGQEATEEGTERLVLRLVERLPDNVRVLMTARRAGWDDVAHLIRLEELPLDVAAAFLREKAGRPDDVDGSLELAEELGGLPLALAHAAAQCRRSPRAFRSYKAEHIELLKKVPLGDEYRKGAVFATVMQGLKQAHRIGGDDAIRLADFVSYCAAEQIPRSLLEQAFDERQRVDPAIEALQDVGLLQDAAAFSDGDPCVRVHRLVQRIIREDTDAQGRSAAVIRRLMPFLCMQLVGADAADIGAQPRDKDLQFQKYSPHLFQALPHLDAPDFRGSDESDLLDDVAKLVVLALARQDADTVPAHLPRLLGCFYELEPLGEPLDALLARIQRQPKARQPHLRAAFCDECLKQGNYVLRVALAEALARAAQAEPPTVPEAEITALIDEQKNDLDHFELGGYALKAIYSERADEKTMDRELLERLARHRCAPGRSILGDLMLNLAHQGLTPSQLLPARAGERHPFWEPRWDYIAYDVNAIRAAELVQANTPPGPEDGAALQEEYAYYLQMLKWREELLQALPAASGARDLVQDFFRLGVGQDRIGAQKAAIADLHTSGHLVLVLRLLFAHPLWSVGETTAGVVAGLIRSATEQSRPREAQAYRDAIRTLLDAQWPWRVRLGAMEAAYQFRHEDDPEKGRMATFAEGVHRYYADPSSKLRGLCAENLVSVMLNASDARRQALERRFAREIRFWLRDEDCWVLEHVHRYFRTLDARGADITRFIGRRFARFFGAKRISRLLAGLDEWWKTDRESFLRHIEDRKEALG